MTAEKPFLFSEGVNSLRQIVDRPDGLPCVVKTRNRLLSFQKVPIEPEGLHLCLEQEVEIEFARIKVLPFYDEDEAVSKHGAEFIVLHSEFENDEFYVPLRFSGKLKIDSYRNKRPRFATVSEVFDQRPRYVRAVTDTMSVSPRRRGGMKTKCVSGGSILEVKEVVTLKDRHTKYLRCVKSNKNFLFKESARINFKAVSDDNEYTLKQIKDAGFWLPKPIQFKQDTILQEHIVQFHSDIVGDISILLTGIVDLMAFVRIRMLIGRAYDKQNKCFKTLAVPASLYEQLHVQVAKFETPAERSRYVAKHFGKPSGRDDLFEDKLFMLSATEDLVYWLQCSYRVDDDIEDSPDDDYQQPPEVLETGTPTTSLSEVAQKKAEGGRDTAVLVQVVQLLPIVGIQDENVLHKVIQKAKLGFGHVHEELRSYVKWDENGGVNRLVHLRQMGKGTPEILNNPSEEPMGDIPLYDDAEILTKIPTKTSSAPPPRPAVLSPNKKTQIALPADDDTETPDEISKHGGHVTKSGRSGIASQSRSKTLSPSERPLPPLPTETKPPLIEKETRVNYEVPVSPGQDNIYIQLEGDIQTSIDEDGEYVEMENEMPDTVGTELNKSNPKHTAGSKEQKASKALGFESYSVEETVKCFKKCGLDRIAAICEQHLLDGYFMINIDQDMLKYEPFCLNPLQINKLRMIYKGWRPKHS